MQNNVLHDFYEPSSIIFFFKPNSPSEYEVMTVEETLLTLSNWPVSTRCLLIDHFNTNRY